MIKWLKEFFNRFALKTGGFFQVIQTASIICGAIAGIPLLIIQFESEMHTVLPVWVHDLSSHVVFFSAAVAWIIAKLPVKDPSIPAVAEKLPFSKK